MVTLSALLGVVTMTALAETNQTSTDTSTTATTTPTATDTTTSSPDGGMQMMDQGGFMGGHGGRGHGMEMMGGGMGGVEISSEYNATVTAILENDTDTANLLSQGYSVTSIHPMIKTVVGGDGTVTAKATTANVILINGTTGFARVNVDIENSKVTYIETITRTVIDKSSS